VHAGLELERENGEPSPSSGLDELGLNEMGRRPGKRLAASFPGRHLRRHAQERLMPKPIEVWFWPTPNGHKITIALEEMGLAYEVKPINIGKGEQFTAEFQALSPNGRMPAIVDPDGPGGKPLSIFESGAILQYLGRKTGQFYPADERARVAVDEWLFWQMAGLGPMSGQANHFRHYAPTMLADQRQVAYGAARYTNEAHRLFGVMEKQLDGRDFLAGDYSIADMAAWPWARIYSYLGLQIEEFSRVQAWIDRIAERPAAAKGVKVGEELRRDLGASSKDAEEARKVLFGQRARG
jgi:glutathione S-transferase/GST-like protein